MARYAEPGRLICAARRTCHPPPRLQVGLGILLHRRLHNLEFPGILSHFMRWMKATDISMEWCPRLRETLLPQSMRRVVTQGQAPAPKQGRLAGACTKGMLLDRVHAAGARLNFWMHA